MTHDQVEAMTMGDRVAVMSLGELMQVDTPLNLYDRPVNLFVAGFIGSPQMNLIKAKAGKDGQAQIGSYLVPVDPAAAKQLGAGHSNITVGVRPEAWRLVGDGEGLPVDVTVVEELGADGFVYGNCDVEGTPSNVIVRVTGRDHDTKHQRIYVTTDPEKRPRLRHRQRRAPIQLTRQHSTPQTGGVSGRASRPLAPPPSSC